MNWTTRVRFDENTGVKFKTSVKEFSLRRKRELEGLTKINSSCKYGNNPVLLDRAMIRQATAILTFNGRFGGESSIRGELLDQIGQI